MLLIAFFLPTDSVHAWLGGKTNSLFPCYGILSYTFPVARRLKEGYLGHGQQVATAKSIHHKEGLELKKRWP